MPLKTSASHHSQHETIIAESETKHLRDSLTYIRVASAKTRRQIANFGTPSESFICTTPTTLDEGSCITTKVRRIENERDEREEVLLNYSKYCKAEKTKQIQALRKERDHLEESLQRKLDMIDALSQRAKRHYSLDEPRSAAQTPTLDSDQSRNTALVRRQLESLPVHRPWFIYTLSVIHVVTCVTLLSLLGVVGVGLDPVFHVKQDVVTFLGLETMEHWEIRNIWIGPSMQNLIGAGSLFSACMLRGPRCDAAGPATDAPGRLGCCESHTWDVAGTMDEQECANYSFGLGVWMEDHTCASRPVSTSNTPHNMKPCCYGIQGQCRLTTFEHCVFLEGTYFGEGPEHCSQVDCLHALCGGSGLPGEDVCSTSRLTSQSYRWAVSPFYHSGLLHTSMVVSVQLLMAGNIEAIVGWLRMSLLYLIPVYTSLLVGAIMTPGLPHVGSEGGIFGLVAVVLVDLLQSWTLVYRPWYEMGKLIAVVLLFLLAGTLPYMDNYSLATGFCMGLISAGILLPSLAVTRKRKLLRLLLRIACSVLAVLAVFLVFYVFYQEHEFDNCEACTYFNCVPYTKYVCKILDLW